MGAEFQGAVGGSKLGLNSAQSVEAICDFDKFLGVHSSTLADLYRSLIAPTRAPDRLAPISPRTPRTGCCIRTTKLLETVQCNETKRRRVLQVRTGGASPVDWVCSSLFKMSVT